MNPYKILGVNEQATDAEVKRAYHAMAAKYHPDAGGDAWVFAQVREAYDKILAARKNASYSAQPVTRSASPVSNQPAASSAGAYSAGQATQYATQATEAREKLPSIGQRTINVLFHHQLPLQSETSYFILANVLDIVFTNVLLRMHHMEANPIANQILIYWGFHGMIAFKLTLVACVCLITQLIAVHHLRRARQTLYFGTLIVGLVVAYSAFLLARGN